MRTSRTAERHARRRNAKASNPKHCAAIGVTSVVVREDVHDGRPIWVVRFAPSGDTKAHEVRMVGLDPSVAYAPLLRDAFITSACSQRAALSRSSLWSMVKNGLLAFLKEDEACAHAFDDDLLSRFSHWLDARRTEQGSLSLRTKRNYFRKARGMLRAGAEAGLAGLDVSRIDPRADPWSGQQHSPPPSKAFASRSDMTAILKGCRLEAERVMAGLGDDLHLLAYDLPGGPVVEEARYLRTLLIDAQGHPEPLDRTLSIAAAGADEVRRAAIALLMPKMDDLMPFVLLLAHYTAFNSSTLMALRIDGIRRRSVGQASLTIVESFKRRSAAMQRAVFPLDDSSTNPDRLLRFVERWTGLLRELTGSKSLWLAVVNAKVVDLADPEGTSIIASRVVNWLRQKALPYLSVSAIRKGMLDLTHLATGGDEIAVRAVGGQKSPDVIDRHYTSAAARRRDRQRLAQGIEEMGRLVGSDGRVDARRLPDGIDRSAATPGFICADRYASPIPGEVPGRSCQAYGHCPVCPLALVDPTSPRSCGYIHLLFERIEEGLAGNAGTSLAAYIATWLPVARRLREHWMHSFDAEVRTKAKQLALIRLPEIE